MRLISIIAVSSLLAIILLALKTKETPAADEGKIRLLIRADDIGSSHSANVACIESYNNGIARSVEVMVNCSWFPEAVELLKKNPGYDVGVHLMLTSEWDMVKWRPLTNAPSLVDSNGYFYPMIWSNDNYPPERTLRGAEWKIEEIEKELRAQIELAISNIPQVSHLSTHMGFTGMDPMVDELVTRLGKEYNLHVDLAPHDFQRMPGWKNDQSIEEKIDTFVKNLTELKPGNYIFVEHPALNDPEMKAVFHHGNVNVARDRDEVTQIFTHPRVLEVISQKGIELVSYNQFK